MAEIGAPPRCINRCLLAQMDNLEEYGIVLTRNCDGPVFSPGDIESRVQIRRGGVAKEIGPRAMTIIDASGEERTIQFIDSSSGEVVCRNPGANLSINAALSKR